MTNVAVTGAAGSVGRETLDALTAETVTPVTHRPHDDIDGAVAELTDPESLREPLDGQDAVVHLAGVAGDDAPWSEMVAVNVEGTYNLFEAARAADVERVVFASTNHVSHVYNVGRPDEPGTTTTDRLRPVTPDDPPRPDSLYGVSKVAGEAVGNHFADRYGMEVLHLRIGWLLTRGRLRELQDAPPERARHARSLWLSPRDWRHLVRRAVRADVTETPLTLNAVSRNDEAYLSLVETRAALGYEPRDDSAEVLAD